MGIPILMTAIGFIIIIIQSKAGISLSHSETRSAKDLKDSTPLVEVPLKLPPPPSTFPCTSPTKCTSYRNCPEVLLKLSNDNDLLVREAQSTYCGEDGPDEPKVCCKNIVLNYLPEHSQDSKNIPVASCGYSNLNLLNKRAKQFLDSDPGCESDVYKGPEELIKAKRGVRNKRLAGGYPSRIGQWPWLATIFYFHNGTKTTKGVSRRCIGTIVTSQVLFSEGSCFVEMKKHINKKGFKVTVGDFDTTDWPSHSSDSQVLNRITFTSPEPQQRKVDMIIHIPTRNDTSIQLYYRENFAIIRLSSPLRFNNYVRPICLHTSDRPSKWMNNHTVVSYSDVDYGSPYKRFGLPRHAVIPVVKLIHCARSKPYFPRLYDILKKVNTKTLICAGGVKEEFLQHMDDGAPLMRQAQDGRWFLSGVHMNLNLFAYLKDWENEDAPHFFTNVTPWIKFLY